MGCDIHIRAEVRTEGKWASPGEVFESRRGESDTKPATRANLEPLTDGELMGAVGWDIGYHGDLREQLPHDVRAAHAAWTVGIDHDRAVNAKAVDDWRAAVRAWEQENPVAAAEYDGYIPDDHPLAYVKVVESAIRQRTGLRRAAVVLTAGERESIIAAVDAYRPYGDDSRLDFTLAPTDAKTYRTVEPWDGRNYNLFAMLADVRNGRGFAGVPTGEGFVPIAPIRGVPDDASDEYRALVKHWDCDGHSHSWHDVAALRAYDWDGQSTTQFGVVPAEVYEQCRAAGKTPQAWTGATSGAGIVTFTEQGYVNWLAGGRPDPGLCARVSAFDVDRDAPAGVIERPVHAGDEVKPYVRMEWRTTYREAAGTAWFHTLDQLEALIPDGGDATDVRLVFFFDN